MKLNGKITKQGFEISKSKIIEKFNEKGYKKLLRKFIIRYKSPIGTFFIEKKNYKIDGDTVIFPRFVASDLLNCKIIDSIDNLIPDGLSINTKYTGNPTDNQKIIIEHIFKNIYNYENKLKGFCGLTLNAQAGCHKIDTEIMMHDGTIKLVQDIKENELLMGDDSTPRKVLNLCRGNEMMYKITNAKNESYIVNENHILCLKYSKQKIILDNIKRQYYEVRWFNNELIQSICKIFSYKNKNKELMFNKATNFFNKIKENLILEIPVINYLELSKSMKKYLKGYKVPIDFTEIKLPLDPYMIGFWLGDSNKNKSVIRTQDAPIINYFQKQLEKYKYYLQYDDKSSEYYYKINVYSSRLGECNYFMNTLNELNLIKNKHIPYIYKCNSRKNRLILLAGILDADGFLSKRGFEFSQTLENEQIIDDIIYLCRSLGFSCYKNKNKTYWTHKGIKKFKEVWRICINGKGIEEIPTLCPRKQVNSRKKIKDVLVSGIKVEKLKNNNYYGFELDGNNRYLMGNFITTHNSGKTFTAMNIINRLKTKTLIVVPNTYLLNQWVDLLKDYFPNNKIGQYYGKQKEDGDIIVAIINSLINDDFTFTSTKLIEVEEIKGKKEIKKIKIKKEKEIITKSYKEYFKEFGFVILDESHIYCTDSFKIAYNRFQSTYMLGLSATPNERTNNCDIISHLNIGKVLIASEIEQYKNDNTKFSAEVSIIKYNGPDKYTNVHINEKLQLICVPKIIEDLINDEFRNKLILDELYKLFDLQLNIFVFSERRNHLEYLYEQFNYLLNDKYINKDIIKNNISIPELDINKNIVLYGNSSDEDINIAKTNSNIIFTTYAYSSTGISINRMTAMVLTTPRKSKGTQIIGRIFRLNKENNHIKRVIIDIVDNKTVLKNQLYERMKAYKERNSEIQTKIVNYTDIKF